MSLRVVRRGIVLICLICLELFGNCKIDNNLMLSILLNEKHYAKEPGYEYLISFNNPADAKVFKVTYEDLFLDARTLDCKNLDTCLSVLNHLLKNSVTNIDLGAYQLNYRYQRLNNSDYFKIGQSYHKACSYVEQMISEVGYSWRGVAAYHSKTEKYNKVYRQNLIATYKAIVNRKIMNNDK